MNVNSDQSTDYGYQGQGRWDNDYLVKPLLEIITSLNLNDRRLFEVGFGNGWIANYFGERGYQISGIEPSVSGTEIAQKAYPDLILRLGNAYDNLHSEFGSFPVVYSVEVIEHCQYPRKYLSTLYDLLDPGGTAIITTPYHGYIKNLAIALTGKTDSHFDPLWDEGHLRFFSQKTLTRLLLDTKFKSVSYVMAGRFAPLHKSMIAIATK